MNIEPFITWGAPPFSRVGRACAVLGYSLALALLLWMPSCGHAPIFEGYETPAAPVVERQPPVPMGAYTEVRFKFEGAGGEMAPARMAIPAIGQGPWPVVVVLYGMGQTMRLFDTAAEAVASQGLALVVFEQYGWGERARHGFGGCLARADVYERARRTYVEARLMLDALAEWPEIDSERRYLWGFSFGGMCAVRIAADDPRYRACILSVCGGDFHAAFPDPDQPCFLRAVEWPLAWSVLPIVEPLDPVPAVSRISPRPVLFQSALHDLVIPKTAAAALQDAAGEPKTVVWYDTGHSRRLNGYETKVFEDGASWLAALENEE